MISLPILRRFLKSSVILLEDIQLCAYTSMNREKRNFNYKFNRLSINNLRITYYFVSINQTGKIPARFTIYLLFKVSVKPSNIDNVVIAYFFDYLFGLEPTSNRSYTESLTGIFAFISLRQKWQENKWLYNHNCFGSSRPPSNPTWSKVENKHFCTT